MRRIALLLWVTAVLWPCAAEAQGDGCQGALNALNRVKEQITPTLSANTAGGKKRLEVMQSALENGTHLCKDNPELWFYRMAVSQRLGLDKDYRYAKDKVDESGYDNHFDPFCGHERCDGLASGNKFHARFGLPLIGLDRHRKRKR